MQYVYYRVCARDSLTAMFARPLLCWDSNSLQWNLKIRDALGNTKSCPGFWGSLISQVHISMYSVGPTEITIPISKLILTSQVILKTGLTVLMFYPIFIFIHPPLQAQKLNWKCLHVIRSSFCIVCTIPYCTWLLWWNLSWETTAIRDHVSKNNKKQTDFWQKVLHFSVHV